MTIHLRVQRVHSANVHVHVHTRTHTHICTKPQPRAQYINTYSNISTSRPENTELEGQPRAGASAEQLTGQARAVRRPRGVRAKVAINPESEIRIRNVGLCGSSGLPRSPSCAARGSRWDYGEDTQTLLTLLIYLGSASRFRLILIPIPRLWPRHCTYSWHYSYPRSV